MRIYIYIFFFIVYNNPPSPHYLFLFLFCLVFRPFVTSEESLVANLRKENQALRERNFPVLQQALTGLRKRHSEYKAEILRLTDSIAAQKAYHHAETERHVDEAARWEREVEVLKDKLRISSEKVEKSDILDQLEAYNNDEVASINNGRLKELVETSTNLNAFLHELIGQVEWNSVEEEGEEEEDINEEEEEEEEEEEDDDEDRDELRKELERLREKAKVSWRKIVTRRL
jgi:hypothetical protein